MADPARRGGGRPALGRSYGRRDAVGRCRRERDGRDRRVARRWRLTGRRPWAAATARGKRTATAACPKATGRREERSGVASSER